MSSNRFVHTLVTPLYFLIVLTVRTSYLVCGGGASGVHTRRARTGTFPSARANGSPPPPSTEHGGEILRNEDGAAPFRVVIHGQGVEVVDDLRGLIERRLRRDLLPFAGRIVVAHVRLWVP